MCRTICVPLVACFVFSPLVNALGVDDPQTPVNEAVVGDVKEGNCVLDAAMSAENLAAAGLSVKSAVKTCEGTEEKEGHKCAADVSGIISAISAISSYISGAVTTCPEAANMHAGCASSVTGLVGATLKIVQVVSNMATDCVDGLDQVITAPFPPPAPTRDENQTKTATCVIDSIEASSFLAKAGLKVASLTQNCPHGDKQHCVSNSLAVAGSLAPAGAFLAPLANVCAQGMDSRALCAADILNLIGNMANIASLATSLQRTCAPQNPLAHVQPILHKSRRLAGDRANTTEMTEMLRAVARFKAYQESRGAGHGKAVIV